MARTKVTTQEHRIATHYPLTHHKVSVFLQIFSALSSGEL